MGNNSRKFFYNLIAIMLSTLFMCSSVQAQLFTRLTADSSYACIKFPSGKFGVGKGSSSGYVTRSFSVASKEISQRLSGKRETLKNKNRIFKEFLADNEISPGALNNILLSQFSPGINSNVVAKVIKLNTGLDKVKGEISLINDELKALKDCQKGKTEFSSKIGAAPATVLTRNSSEVILSVILKVPYAGKYANDFKAFFCRQKEGDSRYSFSSAQKNPCSESSLGGSFPECVAPTGELHLLLVVYRLSATASEETINSAQQEIEKTYGGNYTLKSISDNPTSPCGYLNN